MADRDRCPLACPPPAPGSATGLSTARLLTAGLTPRPVLEDEDQAAAGRLSCTSSRGGRASSRGGAPTIPDHMADLIPAPHNPPAGRPRRLPGHGGRTPGSQLCSGWLQDAADGLLRKRENCNYGCALPTARRPRYVAHCAVIPTRFDAPARPGLEYVSTWRGNPRSRTAGVSVRLLSQCCRWCNISVQPVPAFALNLSVRNAPRCPRVALDRLAGRVRLRCWSWNAFAAGFGH